MVRTHTPHSPRIGCRDETTPLSKTCSGDRVYSTPITSVKLRVIPCRTRHLYFICYTPLYLRKDLNQKGEPITPSLLLLPYLTLDSFWVVRLGRSLSDDLSPVPTEPKGCPTGLVSSNLSYSPRLSQAGGAEYVRFTDGFLHRFRVPLVNRRDVQSALVASSVVCTITEQESWLFLH